MLTVHPSSHESQRRHPHDTPRRAAPNRVAPHHTTPIPTRPTQPIPYHTTPHHTTTQPHCYLQRTAPTPPTTTFATATALNIVLVGIVHEPYPDWPGCCGLSERGRSPGSKPAPDATPLRGSCGLSHMAVKGKKAAANTAKTKATVKNQQCYKAAAKTKATAKNQKATSKTKRAVGALELSASRGASNPGKGIISSP